jgi:hypothetical protein
MAVAGMGGGGIAEVLTMVVAGCLSGTIGAMVMALGKTTELRFKTVSKITKSTTQHSAAAITINPVSMGCRMKDLPD